MNHNADIDTGLEEWQTSIDRERDENYFKEIPSSFNGTIREQGKDAQPFLCTKVEYLQLFGSRFDRIHHPLSYEGGNVSLEGTYEGEYARVSCDWNGAVKESWLTTATQKFIPITYESLA